MIGPVRSVPAARVVFAATALCVLVGLVVQIHVSAGLTGTRFTSTGSRIANVFCYFTVLSNIIAGVTTGLLAWRPSWDSTAFRAWRLSGLVSITITGVIFHLTLADLQDLTGLAAVADNLLHTWSPVLSVLGWLAFGPRGLTSWRAAGLALLYPLAWVALALIRGAIIDFYAYPFVNVTDLGYPRVIVNVVLVGVLFFALAAAALALDRRLVPTAGGRAGVG